MRAYNLECDSFERRLNGDGNAVTAVFGDPAPAVAAAATVAPLAAASVATPAPSPSGKRGHFGIDSLIPSSSPTLTTFRGVFGNAPAFWARYFYAPGQINSSGHHDNGHYSAGENAMLRANNIRVLPIARQTGNTGSDAAAQASGRKLAPPVLAWQFSDTSAGYDTNQCNPAHDDILLSRLVLPPN